MNRLKVLNIIVNFLAGFYMCQLWQEGRLSLAEFVVGITLFAIVATFILAALDTLLEEVGKNK